MIYGYCRVSSRGQLDNNSLEAQTNAILSRYPSAEIHTEQHTGKTTHRPVLEAVTAKLAAGDTLVAAKLDRLARNTTEGLDLIRSLFARGVAVHILNVGLLEDSAMGRFFITTLLAVAEMERTTIAERMSSGKEIARTKPGYREGRPRTYDADRIAHAMGLLQTCSYTQTAKATGISKSTLQRTVARSKAASLVASSEASPDASAAAKSSAARRTDDPP